MGLLSAAKLKELVTAAAAQRKIASASITKTLTSSIAGSSFSTAPILLNKSVSSTIPTSSSATFANKPKSIPPGAQKIVIQTASGVQKQVVLPPHLYKLAQQGQIKAVSIAGKGIQYVRVNPPTGPKPVAGTSQRVIASTSKFQNYIIYLHNNKIE